MVDRALAAGVATAALATGLFLVTAPAEPLVTGAYGGLMGLSGLLLGIELRSADAED